MRESFNEYFYHTLRKETCGSRHECRVTVWNWMQNGVPVNCHPNIVHRATSMYSDRELDMRLTIALIVVFALTPLHAEDSVVWNNLARLTPGDQILVVRKDMASVEAQFVSFSDSSITLRSGNSDSVAEKDSVVRVSTKPQGQRKYNAIYRVKQIR